MNRNLSRKQVYWLLQISSWTIFYVLSASIYVNRERMSERLAVNVLANIVLMISVTHLYRVIAIRARWINFSMSRLLILSGLYCIVVAIPLAIINIELDSWTFKNISPAYTAKDIYDYAVHISRNLLPWVAFYVVYIYFEKLSNSRYEKLQLESEINLIKLSYFKSQLNPHFLFNALNSIRTLVEINPDESKKVIERLGTFLRNTLDKNESVTIRLSEEIRIAEDYLYIEKTRFGERLVFTIETDEASKDVMIPPMIIQGMVENAIKHGISKLKKGGVVNIRSIVRDKFLNVEVINSGQYRNAESQNGLGIRNSLMRLQLLYGNKASLVIENKDSEHVISKLKLPV